MKLPAGSSATSFVEQLKHYLAERAHLVPYMTNKIQWDKSWLGRPNWVRDTQFDINNHVQSVPVAAPGKRRELEQAVARLHEQPMDRNHPLWRLVVITGLPDGHVAYYNAVHHACLDGVAGQASYNYTMDKSPVGQVPAADGPVEARPQLSLAEHAFTLAGTMMNEFVQNVFGAPARLQAAGRLVQRSMNPSQGLGALLQPAPATPLNRSIDRGRTYATGEFKLDTVKRLSKATNSSINDVFLTICGGALRRYLNRKNSLPLRSLIAACPVSLRRAGDATNNNQVTLMKVALGTNVQDPAQRLLEVRRSARVAREVTALAAEAMPPEVTLPGAGITTRAIAQLANTMPLAELLGAQAANVLISNVPGPRETLYSNGARMMSHYPVSIPAHGMGVNITVQSYAGQLWFGVTACARTMPDADLLRDDMLLEFAALHTALTADILDLDPSNHPEKAGAQPQVEAGFVAENDDSAVKVA